MTDRQNFSHMRIGAIAREELKTIKMIPGKGETVIARQEQANGHSLRGLFEKLAGDPDMVDRYNVGFDDEANQIRLVFRRREIR